MSNHPERIEYILDTTEDGKTVYVGRSVNYKVCAQADSYEMLEKKMKAMIDMWLKFGMDTMAMPQPLEFKEITKDIWMEDYKEYMKTSKWIAIADGLYDSLRDLVGDDWTNPSVEMYENNTMRKAVRDKKFKA